MSRSVRLAPRRANMALAALAMAASSLFVAHSARAADSPVVISTYAGLENIKISLVDLDPNDGISPGVSFSSGSVFDYTLMTVYPDQTYTYAGPRYENSITPDTELSYTSKGGYVTLTASPGHLAAQSAITLDQLLTKPVAPNQFSVFDQGELAVMSLDKTHAAGSATFTLTPNTAMTITGQAVAGQDIDTDAIRAWAASHGYEDFSFLSRQEEEVASMGVGVHPQVYQETSAYLHDDAVQASMLEDFDGGRLNHARTVTPFNFSAYNRDVQSLTSSIGAVVRTGIVTNLALTPAVGTVPEPSTWAMMLLGMAGLLVRRSSTRRV